MHLDNAKQAVSKRFIFSCMFFFLVNGAILLLISSILIYLMQYYNLSYAQGGFLLTIQAIGGILTNFFSSSISIAIGRKKTLIITAVLFFIGLLIITFTPPLPVLYIGLFITGLAWGASNNLINFLLVRETEGDSGIIASVHTVFSIGAFAAPLLVALSVKTGIGWRWAAGFVCFLAFLLIFEAFRMPIRESTRTAGTKPVANTGHFRDWRFYAFMAMFFLYVGIETGISGWLVSYLVDVRYFTQTSAQSMLSVLWIAIIAGRLTVSIIGSRLNKAGFLLFESSFIVISTLILILSDNAYLTIAAVVLLGLALSAFFAMVVSNATYIISRSTQASGLMMAFGSIGASTLPLVAGVFARSGGLVTGLWALFACAIILLALTLTHYFLPEKNAY